MFLAEIDQSQIATLSNIGTTETAFSLGVGGPAILTIPSAPLLDGVGFRLVVSAKIHVDASGHSFTPSVYVGSSATLASDQGLFTGLSSITGGTDFNLLLTADIIWDSTSQKINADGRVAGSSIQSAGIVTGITAQTNLQFIIAGKFGTSNVANTATIVTYKLETV